MSVPHPPTISSKLASKPGTVTSSTWMIPLAFYRAANRKVGRGIGELTVCALVSSCPIENTAIVKNITKFMKGKQ